ncbi:SDR family NAD(P)-dependent oxidoreductase [Paenibacillus brasilensis]|uniref:SDR family NAD(P)-dependent oxidoreductase n=1 Tax=Paenibacillus brasilensis TaxID=128574 RepID=UPI003522C867
MEEQPWTEGDLADIAYTLQTGREAMEERLGVLADSIGQLKAKLWGFAAGQDGIENLYRGQVKRNKDTLAALAVDEEMQETIEKWIQRGKYGKIADLWTKSLAFDWNKLYGSAKRRRVSLPTYPFAKERYWIDGIGEHNGNNRAVPTVETSVIHPLLHRNTSDLLEQRFTSTFTGKEFFLESHVVKGQRVLPGVAYLEMARAAVEHGAGALMEEDTGIRLKNIVWVRPIIAGAQPVQIHIGLFPEKDGEISYEIYSDFSDKEPIIYSQGHAVLNVVKEITTLNLTALQQQCNQGTFTSAQCYEAFRAIGFDYGPGHQAIENVYMGSGQLLAKLSLPPSVSATRGQFVIHPSLADAALQTSMCLMMGSHELKTAVPFALDEIEIFGSNTASMWAFVRYSRGSEEGDKIRKLDVDLCDDNGNIYMKLRGFTSRVFEGDADSEGASVNTGTLMLKPGWNEQQVLQGGLAPVYGQHVVILCGQDEAAREKIEAHINGVQCMILQSQQSNIDELFQIYTVEIFEKIQSILKERPKDMVLIQVVVPAREELQFLSGLTGLLKTAQLENPKLIGQLIEVESWEGSEGILEKLKENSRSPVDTRIRYQEGKRFVTAWSEIEAIRETAELPWKDRGIYLVTGGAGGLGLIFAKEIANKVKNPTLILTGRSLLGAIKQAKLDELKALDARVEYRQLDVTQREDVIDFIRSVQAEFGGINGIIHSAGVIKDNFILRKNKADLLEVLKPKVSGLLNLDHASMELPLDFFILFSSTAGCFGNVGQADYAVANAFMDAYARYRNTLTLSKQRQGQTLSINWPLWKDGGMSVNAEIEKTSEQNKGIVAMQTKTGIQALYKGLASGEPQVMVIEGDIRRFQETLERQLPLAEVVTTKPAVEATKGEPVIEQHLLHEKAVNYFKTLLSSVIKLPPHRIEADAPMEKYGIDSIMAMELTNKLEKPFGSLSRTLFFEYQSIQELTGHFLESHLDKLIELLGIKENAIEDGKNSKKNVAEPEPVKQLFNSHRRLRFTSSRMKSKPEKLPEDNDIAIIGLSGRYPGAKNIQEFWNNLRDGKDCITEIPGDRWDHSLYFDEARNTIGKTYCKWGGFIEDIDKFDPLFFNISPREAEIIDPLDRLFLETVWNALETCGYTRENLQRLYQANVGVFAGAMYHQYHSFDLDISKESAMAISSYSSIANRVSHFFNFQGPSVAIDTMCSSATIAIHMACESLIKGECQLAIAGGANLSIHPRKYLGLSQVQMLGSHTDSRSFGKGDGYLPSEGVGVVLLKPLSKARMDGDSILAVIKSTSTNHGGHTNGFSVPNPNAQAQLIENNFTKSGIDPRTVSYVEAAANGSALGDPIEITALNNAFRKFTTDQQFCVIGSVKSNIGHPEAVSGMAQLTKVILQLQHKKLVPSIKVDPLNPNINLDHTPFYLQKELIDWKRPVITMDGVEQEYPRRATVSSFGAGGSNAHLIIEEYQPEQEDVDVAPGQDSSSPEQLMVFSAKNAVRLQLVVRQMLEFLRLQDGYRLSDIAHTLQAGREAMECRLAMVVSSREELIEGMEAYLKSVTDHSGINASVPMYTGNYEADISAGIRSLLSGKLEEVLLQELIAENNLEKLALCWVQGSKIPWELLHSGKGARIVALPTYPFEKRRCWAEHQKATGLSVKLEVPEEVANEDTATEFESLSDQVMDILSIVLGMSPSELDINKPLEQYGFDSILLMSLFQQLQSRMEFSVTLDNLRESRTAQDIVNILKEKSAGVHEQTSIPKVTIIVPKDLSEYPEIIHLNESVHGQPVFWFHPGLGGVESYQGIARNSQRPFYGIQARGWMSEREPLQGISSMAEYYIQIIQAVQPEGPYDLGGYSLGGDIAYEVTRKLQKMGQKVNTIVMLDTLDSNALNALKNSDKDLILQTINVALISAMKQKSDEPPMLIHRDETNLELSDEVYLNELIELAKSRGLNKTTAQLHKMIQKHLDIQKSYKLDKFSVLPLLYPEEVTCYYFRNKGGKVYGDLEPYASTVPNFSQAVDGSKYWGDWEREIPKLYMIDVDPSCHMTIFDEPNVYEKILKLCKKLYFKKVVSDRYLKNLIENLQLSGTGSKAPV